MDKPAITLILLCERKQFLPDPGQKQQEATRCIISQNDEVLSHLPNAQTVRKTIYRQHQWLNELPHVPNANEFFLIYPKIIVLHQHETQSFNLVKPYWRSYFDVQNYRISSRKILITGLQMQHYCCTSRFNQLHTFHGLTTTVGIWPTHTCYW